MGTLHIGKVKATMAGLFAGVFASVLVLLAPALPAHAASVVQIDWVDATTIKLGGSALKSSVNVPGDFVGNVFGTPPGSQTYMATTNGAVDMSFGCSVSMTLDISPDASGKLDFTKGELVFTTSAPSTCSQDTLRANIDGLTHDPSTGAANLSLMNNPIGSVDNRGPAGGTDTPSDQIVNVTAGMGPASDYNNIPQTDIFTLCEVKGSYTNNIDALYDDCLARKTSALSANPVTSNNLQTITDGKGPNGGDEKGWTGKFTGVKAGIYVVCSADFKSCQLFTKNPGQIANVYVSYGSTAGSIIPGDPPGQGGPGDQQVCTTGPGLSGALAWIICPAVQLIASATNFFENNIIIPFMTVSPLTTNGDNPIYILWQDIRNFANVGFILFFFIVIFSQATSIGISNYGIKRILPKMVVVVIGVNLSYFIVAFIIDAFNIFGSGISQLIIAALNQAHTTQLNTGTSAGSVRSIFTLGGAALLAIVATGGAAIGWFFSFMGLALLVVVVTVIVLVVRQMAIILLVILAPLAILMYMLPNTEGYFNKWRKTLTQLLFMYPMIVLLFGAGKIFGIILQQPDFKLAGDGVSDDVAQAVRVILQFLIYVIPLVFLPATFAASGALMSRGWALLHSARTKGLVQKPGQSFQENVIKPKRQELQMRGARRGGVVGKVAGYSYRKRFKREQRERELTRAQQEYLARQVTDNEGFAGSAAGIGGQPGVTRVQAGAVSQLEKQRQEEMANEGAILASELRRVGISSKEFNNGLNDYLQGPTATKPHPEIIMGTNGQTIDLQTDQRITRAALNAAAAAGEVSTIENARMNPTIDQGMLDEVIRNNDGKLKEKGGYHLATQFNLASGRMTFSSGPNAGKDIAIDDIDGMRSEVARQRLLSVSQTASSDIADMKASTLSAVQNSLLEPDASGNLVMSQQGTDLLNSLSSADKTRLKTQLEAIVTNPNLIGRAQNREAIEHVYSIL